MTEERKAAERLLFRGLAAAGAAAALIWLTPEAWDKLSPFILAIPIAAMLQPLIALLQRKLKLGRGAASLIPVLLLLAAFLGLVAWGLRYGIGQIIDAARNSGDIIGDVTAYLREIAARAGRFAAEHITPDAESWLRNSMNDTVARVTQWGTTAAAGAMSFAMNLAASLPYIVIYISFLTMGLYFISKEYPEIRSYLPGGERRKQDSNATKLTHSALRSLMGYLRVQGVFGLIVLVLSWIYLQIFGFHYAVVFALIAGAMELIPMVGSGAFYLFLAAGLFLGGNSAHGIQVLILTGLLQLLRRILEPKLMSDNIGITPLESLIGMFVGLRFGGILGLIGGPVLMSVLVGAIRGRFFEGVRKDVRCLIRYFRKRWDWSS